MYRSQTVGVQAEIQILRRFDPSEVLRESLPVQEDTFGGVTAASCGPQRSSGHGELPQAGTLKVVYAKSRPTGGHESSEELVNVYNRGCIADPYGSIRRDVNRCVLLVF